MNILIRKIKPFGKAFYLKGGHCLTCPVKLELTSISSSAWPIEPSPIAMNKSCIQSFLALIT